MLGLYLSYKNSFIDHGPDSNNIRTIKYNHQGKCYKLTPTIIPCNSK